MVGRQFVLCLVIGLGVSLGSAVSAQAPARQKREISWVNPELPSGTGLSHHILASKALGHDVGYVVWTPAGYEEHQDQRYPVIYFLHGAGGNESADAGGFSSRVADAIRKQTLPPVLCVFPNGGMSGYRGEVETMLVDELIPHIDRSYRTMAQSESRAIAGFSMGGAGATRLLFTHPQLFCAAASWGGGARSGDSSLVEAATAAVETLKQRNTALLQIKGDADRPEGNQEFAEQLNRLGLTNEMIVLENTNHNLGLYYEKSADAMMQFLGRHIRP